MSATRPYNCRLLPTADKLQHGWQLQGGLGGRSCSRTSGFKHFIVSKQLPSAPNCSRASLPERHEPGLGAVYWGHVVVQDLIPFPANKG